MAQKLAALIVEADPDGRLDTARAVEAMGFEVAGQAAYGTEATFLAAQERPNMVLLALEDPPTRGLSTLEALQRLAPDTPVIAYSSSGDAAMMRRAMRSGARDFLRKPLDPDELREAVFTVLSHEEQRQMARWSETSTEVARGTVVTIVSAKGGVGKTTIAANLAVALHELTSQEVALIDGDAQFGESALLLDVEIDAGIGDLTAREAEFNRQTVSNYVRRHESGVDLLAAPMEPDDWRPLTPEQLAAIAQSLAEGHEYVLVDAPALGVNVTSAALHESAVVLLITSLELASVKNTKNALRMFDSWSIPRERVRLVVNDNSRVSGVTVEDVASATGVEVTLHIGYDAAVAPVSQAGVPIVTAQPKSKFARSVHLLARSLAGMPTDGARGGRSFVDRLPSFARRVW